MHETSDEEPAVPEDIKNDDTQLVNNLINQGQAGQLTSSTQDLETSSQCEEPAGHTDSKVHLTSQDRGHTTLQETSSQCEGPDGHTDRKVHLISQNLCHATLPETSSQSEEPA